MHRPNDKQATDRSEHQNKNEKNDKSIKFLATALIERERERKKNPRKFWPTFSVHWNKSADQQNNNYK